jgi:pimeloyl-ACP methyl ester carboxylesterase
MQGPTAKQCWRLAARAPRVAAVLSAVLLAAPGAGAVDLSHQVEIQGSGAKTVVFEAGAGDTLEAWHDLPSQLVADHCARTFVYTRAGYIGSDTPDIDVDRDAVHVVQELREELRHRHVKPPYVLVGHSLGGLYMQYYARNFPDEVAGLVLIDSTHWNQGLTVDPTANTPYQSRRAVTLFMPWIMRRELTDSAEAGREVADSPAAGQLPVLVLSSTRGGAAETDAQRERAIALQNEIAAQFPAARHEFIANAGHYIQRDQPGAVIAAIREIAGCR